jgi:xanthine dehydrogenase accessory factor
MSWLQAVARLRATRTPGVLVTVTATRGHAPRGPGAKMVVAATEQWGSIGGGNLEETALEQARGMLSDDAVEPATRVFSLSDKVRTEHGRQCCGGEVTVVFEPLPVVPAVAIFGLGHVGLELARILARHDLDLHLVDSRADRVTEDALAPLADAVAVVHAEHAPLPEVALGTLPPGCTVLILTHDHAEDFALCDTVLRSRHLGPVGVIGSAAKWSRFRQGLLAEGHTAEQIDRIQSPIGRSSNGRPPISGKEPAMIALAVATEILSGAGDRTRRVVS